MKFPICFSFVFRVFYLLLLHPLCALFTITTLLVTLLVIISFFAYPASVSLLSSPLPMCVHFHGLLLSVFHSPSIYLPTTNPLFFSIDSEVTGANDSM